MARGFRFCLISVLACAGFAPAHAAPAVFAVKGSVGNFCSVSGTLPDLTFTEKATGNGNALNPNTANLGYNIVCNVKSSLTMQATALHTAQAPQSGESQIGNYTATLSPWGSGSVTATTTASASDNGTTKFPASPVPVSSGAAVSASGNVAISNPTLPSGTTKFEKTQVYSASVTLTLTPNN